MSPNPHPSPHPNPSPNTEPNQAAVLATMGLKALGLAELHEQEQAVRALGSLGTLGAPEHANRLQVQRVALRPSP